MEYSVESSETEFRGRLINVRRDRVRTSDGRTRDVEVVEHPGAVLIVPIDDQSRVWFVRQYRHAVGERLLELPAGTLAPGEAPEACAARECREEIGMSPGRLIPIGGLFLAPGYSSEYIHLFLAQDLRPDPLAPDEDEALEMELIPLEEVTQWVSRGDLRDSKSIAAIFLATLG
jgi:ADP-ribose pyrophosphatase